jgi:hypothetical protein
MSKRASKIERPNYNKSLTRYRKQARWAHKHGGGTSTTL